MKFLSNNIDLTRLNSLINYNDFCKFNDYALFVDPCLTYDQQMYLLNRRSSVEKEFIETVQAFICTLKISDEDRHFLMANIEKLEEKSMVVDSSTRTTLTFGNQYDSDEYEDEDEDDLNETDTSNADLENSLLDYYDNQYFIDSLNERDQQ